MENMVIELLRASGADAWTVSFEQRTGWEFYFIRHRLDQNRARDTETVTLTLFRRFTQDGTDYLGSASAQLPPTATAQEAKALIDSLLGEALLVRNPVYTLNPPRAGEEAAGEEIDLKAISGDFIRAIRSVEESESEDVNSYEIFVERVGRRFVSSTGIDVTDIYPASMAEVVVNARRMGHEIELYRMFRSGRCDAAGLKAAIEQTLRFGRDKLRAVKTPTLGRCDVVFTTDDALQIYQYFIGRLSTAMIFQRVSDCAVGKRLTEDGGGDALNIRALRTLENSSRNAAYDAEGAPVRDLCLVRDGVAENLYGPRMFADYLGLSESFNPGNFAVAGGKSTAEELRFGRYLEVVEFSDFHVDPLTGNIAGEIRLGYLHDGDTVTVVEGGSVSGSMRELGGAMRFSCEQKQYNNYLVPALTRLPGATVTGAE